MASEVPALLMGARREIEAVGLAFVAGALGYCMRTVKQGKKVRIVYALLEASSSGFVGYLVFLLCKALGIDPNYAGAIVGVCGWVGAAGTIRLLETFVFKRLGIEGKVSDVATESGSAVDGSATGSSASGNQSGT